MRTRVLALAGMAVLVAACGGSSSGSLDTRATGGSGPTVGSAPAGGSGTQGSAQPSCQVPAAASTFDAATWRGCTAYPDAQDCGATCAPACGASQFLLSCSDGPGPLVPAEGRVSPDPSLTCTILPVPTPATITIYCCDCAR